MKKRVRWDYILLGVAAACFGIFGHIYYSNIQLEEHADQIKDQIKEISDSKSSACAEDGQGQTTQYDSLFEWNEDMIAWLQIPDTNIDYPVMFTPQDEEYYLYRDFFKNDDKNGTLFMDTDCSLQDERANLIIHGHHMKSGAMFGSLPEYMDETYAEKHPKIYLYTRDDTRVYEVMSVFNAKVYKGRTDKFKYYDNFRFDSQETFDEYYQNIKNMSMYDTGVTAVFGDEFITLSTCAYHTNNGRFAVVGKRVE